MVNFVIQRILPYLGHPIWKASALFSLCLLLFLTLTPSVIQLFPYPNIDKLYHFIAFAGVTLLFRFAFYRWSKVVLVIAMVILGLFIEVAQIWVPGRSFSWLDWIADSFGVLAVAWFPLQRWFGKSKNNASETAAVS